MAKRDLTADMAICESATAGPDWHVIKAVNEDTDVYYEFEVCSRDYLDSVVCATNDENIARFIAEARTGWPHAIERALLAERTQTLQMTRIKFAEARNQRYDAEIKRLRAALERMDDRKNPMLPRSEMARMAKSALDYTEVVADAANEE